MKNPILRYRIAIALLLGALAAVSLGYQQIRSELALTQEVQGLAVLEMHEARERADRAESRLSAIDRGVIIPQGARRAIAEGVERGEPILVPGLDMPKGER